MMAKFTIKSILISCIFYQIYQVNCLIYENSYKQFINYVYLGFESYLIENITKSAFSNSFYCLSHCSKRNECKMVIENKQNCFLLNSCFDFNKISNENSSNVYVKSSFSVDNGNGLYITICLNITSKNLLIYYSNPLSLIGLPNGHLASGHQDSKILIWDLNNGTIIKYLIGHSGGVNYLFLNKNSELISGSKDGTIKIWNLNDGSMRLNIPSPSNLSVSSLAVLENGDLVCSFSDYIIRILDVNNGIEKGVFIGHGYTVNSIIVLNNIYIASGSSAGSVIIWNINNKSIHKIFPYIASSIIILTVLINGDLAIGGMDTTVRILSLNQNKIVRNLTRQSGTRVNSLAVLPNGDLISGTDDKSIIIWNAIDGTVKKELKGSIFGSVVSLAILNSSFFVSGSLDTRLIIWG